MRLLFWMLWVPMFLRRMAKYGDLEGYLEKARSAEERRDILREFEQDALVEIRKCWRGRKLNGCLTKLGY